MESVHWGLGSGLGALLGGFAYSSLGPVVLFKASAIMSFLSMLFGVHHKSKHSQEHEIGRAHV